jgi:hypothetical protein
LNQKKGHEQSTEDGSDGFENVDLSDGRDIFSDVLGIEFTPVSEKGALGQRDREEDEEGGIKDGRKSKSLSRRREKDAPEYSGKVDGEGQGHGKEKLEESKDLYFLFYFFYGLTGDKRADRGQDKPVGEDDSEGKLVAVKRDEQFSHQDDLSDDTAQSLNEERGLEGRDVHHSF